MQRHAASARSEAAECRKLQQLLSIYFHWGSVFGIHSSPSELLLGPPGQDLLFHPPVHPPIRVHLPLCTEVRSVRICTSEGQTHYFRSSDLSTFFFLVFLSFPHFCPLDFITGGITTEFSDHRWVALPVFSREAKSPQYRGVEAIRLVVRPRGLIY